MPQPGPGDIAAGLAGSPLFEGIGAWLIDEGQRGMPVDEIVAGTGRRLVAGGIPICRLAIGGMVLHPVFGGMDVVWDAESDRVRNEMVPREFLATPEFQNAPFFYLACQNSPFLRAKLDQGLPEPEPDFAIYHRLRATGVTDYLAFFRSYGRTEAVKWAELPAGIEGVQGSFATRRIGGFADLEIEYLRALTGPLALAVKSATTYDLANALLDAYLGRYSGTHVLDGLIERGDGRIIDCVLWYSDLRNSTGMADEMPLDDYLATLDDYFDCTAGAVIDHGGEVLKFVGDAVMAIFPVESVTRPRTDMCRAAVMTARDALSRCERRNAARAEAGQPPVRFGIALHSGDVMYGNVGTRRRLDFTVIGPAVNEVTRLEGLCKKLATPVTISQSFRDAFPGDLVSLGSHEIAGKADVLDVYTLPELAAGAGADGGNVTPIRG